MREIRTRSVVADVVADLVDLILARSPAPVHIALTGGRAGQEVSRALAPLIEHRRNVHLWFSDERYLPAGDSERNDAMLPSTPDGRIHRVAGPDSASDVVAAARAYATQLREGLADSRIDVTVLSIGPDGHVASLFPGSAALTSSDMVAAVTDSPKPPPVRITWTFPMINASRQVWLLAVGQEKAAAVSAVRSRVPIAQCPACGVSGQEETRLYTDVD